ncbi:MAG: endoribonuclease MazF [Deltaproteobacteria bacterium]|jgi:mRNA interferase MazF|nr:endoribonuclease MazF [Deltaproteobacteria bacterium]
MDTYIPEQGDFVWINMNPQLGHEQAGRRPAIILSPVAYNKKVDLALLCPITNQIKGYPFEVIIPIGLGVSGVILSDQVKSFDWKARNTEFIGKASETTTLEVLKKINTLLQIPALVQLNR